MNAVEVKDALRRRHPARDGFAPGPWTVIEEWMGIDVLAISAWASVGRFSRVGYEVKVSRSDFRRELLRPHKRVQQVGWCNEFYLAAPSGLLKADELTYEEPEWEPGDFERVPCPARLNRSRDSCWRGKVQQPFIGPLGAWQRHDGRWVENYRGHEDVPCQECGGKGYLELSRVEREAPMLWVPRDVGLVLVSGRGTTVVKPSPRRKTVEPLTASQLGKMLRWVSMRPDPRHHGEGPAIVMAADDASG